MFNSRFGKVLKHQKDQVEGPDDFDFPEIDEVGSQSNDDEPEDVRSPNTVK